MVSALHGASHVGLLQHSAVPIDGIHWVPDGIIHVHLRVVVRRATLLRQKIRYHL